MKGMTCLQDYMYVPEVEARQTLSSSLPSVQGSSHGSSDEEEEEEEEVRAGSRKISPGLYAPDALPPHSVMNSYSNLEIGCSVIILEPNCHKGG